VKNQAQRYSQARRVTVVVASQDAFGRAPPFNGPERSRTLYLNFGNRSQGAADARRRARRWSFVLQVPDKKADAVPCERLPMLYYA
jgi:hypothetical protein